MCTLVSTSCFSQHQATHALPASHTALDALAGHVHDYCQSAVLQHHQQRRYLYSYYNACVPNRLGSNDVAEIAAFLPVAALLHLCISFANSNPICLREITAVLATRKTLL
jgi:hypothetical protein